MKINVEHIAKLANLPLTDEEVSKFELQLSEILRYVDQLQQVDTSSVSETSQVTGLENVLRADSAKSSLSQEEAISNTKSQHNGLFQVKGILDND